MMEKSVYIIILNYKNLEDTLMCLESLRKITYSNYRIIVVDNDSRDGSYEYLKEHAKGCHVMQSGENRGYAAGNNIGIRYALEQEADYICILNNDVEVEPDFLTVLIKYMEDTPGVGMAGPAVYEFNEREKIQSAGFSITVRTGSTNPLQHGAEKRAVEGKRATYCDGLSGTCLLVRKEVLEKAGLIPECYFLFFEEMEWCLNVRSKGYKLATVFGTGVYHKGSASIKKTGTLSRYYMARNRVLFVRRNGSVLDLVTFLLTEGVGYVFRYFFSSKKEIRKIELKGFYEGLTLAKESV